MNPTIPLLSALLLAPAPRPAPAAGAGARPAPRRTAPEVRAEGYRFVIERFIQQQNLTQEFPEDKPADLGGRQHFYLALSVYPSDPKMAANIQGLDPRIIAFSGTQVMTLRSYPPDDDGPGASGVWRTQLAAQELDLNVSRLSRLQGELIVFPKAKRMVLDFPLPIKEQQVVKTDEGFKATLKNFRTTPGRLNLTIDMEWPSEYSVSLINTEAPGGITALTRAGTALIPNGAGTSGTERNGRVLRIHNIALSDLKELPAKIRVELLVRSGAPKKIPFTMPEITLPDMLALETEAPGGGQSPALVEHPFYSQAGGTVVASVRDKRVLREGHLLLGLSRQEGTIAGPWRWLEVMPDDAGKAALANVRPGRYRVSQAWVPDAPGSGKGTVTSELPRSAVPLGAPATIDVVAGKSVALAPADPGAAR